MSSIEKLDPLPDSLTSGFKSVLSNWKTKTNNDAADASARFCRRTSRAEAKKEFLEKRQKGELAHVKEKFRALNIYQTPIDDFKESATAATASVEIEPISHATEKDENEKQVLINALKNNFVFSGLSPNELEPLSEAFEKAYLKKGEKIIRQGDKGDYFYIISKGKIDFTVDGKVVASAGPGSSFGELSLLYTVRANSFIR
jgi:hypothetical protein